MDVWVILQTSVLGVQNRVCTHLTVEIGVTTAKGSHGQSSRSQQKVMRCSLMLPEPGPEFIRHCEGQQKIRVWQELGCQPLDSLLAFKMLAVRGGEATAHFEPAGGKPPAQGPGPPPPRVGEG
jgi:hypothetical protein